MQEIKELWNQNKKSFWYVANNTNSYELLDAVMNDDFTKAKQIFQDIHEREKTLIDSFMNAEKNREQRKKEYFEKLPDDLESMTVPELKIIAQSLGTTSYGKKAEIIQHLRNPQFL